MELEQIGTWLVNQGGLAIVVIMMGLWIREQRTEIKELKADLKELNNALRAESKITVELLHTNEAALKDNTGRITAALEAIREPKRSKQS